MLLVDAHESHLESIAQDDSESRNVQRGASSIHSQTTRKSGALAQ